MYLLMLDMSKAFDTVNRSILLKDLSSIIEPDELHLIKVLLNTQLKVKCGSSISEVFKTNTGVPQGDSLSANEFTFYLAKALEVESSKHVDHDYTSYEIDTQKTVQHDHNYHSKPNDTITIDQEYADDMSTMTTNSNIVASKKQTLPKKLDKRDLMVNETKTEEYVISRGGNIDWKKCKLLGSLLDTIEDFHRRKGLAVGCIANLKHIFCRKVSIEVKLRAFNCYVASIFLYNSELWTITKKLENEIDSFHRKLIRSAVLNVIWPKKLKNEEVYEKSKMEPWSIVVRKRQLSWFGHLMRLPNDAPAKLSLHHVLHYPTQRPRGRQLTTWISMMCKRFEEMGKTWEQMSILAQDRVKWKTFQNSVVY